MGHGRGLTGRESPRIGPRLPTGTPIAPDGTWPTWREVTSNEYYGVAVMDNCYLVHANACWIFVTLTRKQDPIPNGPRSVVIGTGAMGQEYWPKNEPRFVFATSKP